MRQGDRGAGRCWRRPARVFSVARSFGCLARLVCAEEAQLQLRVEAELVAAFAWDGVRDAEGREGRRVGRVGAAALERRRWSPSSLQLVPLRVNSLRLTLTKIERMSSLAPPKTSGISATAWICAVSGSRLSATRTTTVPRSNGPASAGVIDDQRERRALVGPGEVGLAVDLQRRGAGAGCDRGDADLALVRAARAFLLCGAGAAPRPRRSPRAGSRGRPRASRSLPAAG